MTRKQLVSSTCVKRLRSTEAKEIDPFLIDFWYSDAMLDVIRLDDVNFRGYPQEPQLQWTPKSQNKINTNYRIQQKKMPCIFQK